MDKKTWIVIGVIVLAFAGVIGISLAQNSGEPPKAAVASAIESYDEYDLQSIIPADENSGNMSENVKGDLNAPVLIFEYADYQCEGCAAMNPYLNQLVEEYDGKVAVVYRGYVLDYHPNGTAAASAANAAALQGYWVEYKDLLFANQDDWYSAQPSKRQKLYEQYFVEATGGQGDLIQFREDMGSQQVAQKIQFDRGIAEIVGLDWTPSIWVGDELVPRTEMTSSFLQNMRDRIDAKLKELGQA